MKKEQVKIIFWWLAAFLFMIGLLFSPFILSLSFLVLLLWVFIYNKPSSIFIEFKKRKLNLVFIAFFLVFLFGYFLSSDKNLFLSEIRNKFTFLILPLALCIHLITSKSRYLLLILIFNSLVFILGILSFINYLIHYQLYNTLILAAKPIPIVSGINHIYFSIILAASVIFNFLIFFNAFSFDTLSVSLSKRLTKWISFIFGISGIVFLHTISAKTGLVAFYMVAITILVLIAIKKRKYLHIVAGLVLFGIMGILSIKYIGVLNNRWKKTLEDINMYENKGNINYYSISTRLEYWQKSIIIFKDNPLVGVGNSDVKKEINRLFEEEKSVLNEKNRLNSHNQYLNILAGTGLLGFSVFVILMVFLFWETIKNRDLFKLSFLLICCVAFLFESVLERQVGIAFFTFFSLFSAFRNEESFVEKGL